MAITAARLEVQVGADTSQAEAGLQSFSGKMNSITRGLGGFGTGLSLAVSAPLIGIAKSAIDMAGDFEQSLNVLQQVTGASTSVMAAMQDQALQLGADTVFSANEAADAMLELGKAGMDSEQIMASIAGVMDLAAAANVGLGEAASITASTLNAFGLEASESTRIADLMAAAANASAADIVDLSQGMRQAGFVFHLANQPVENLAASLAILTNRGLTGSDAGTALKNAFMRMMNPTEEAKGVMNELGISFYDASGQMRALPDIIDILNRATATLTDQQRDAALATIFLSDGMKAMTPLMDEGRAGFESTLGAVTEFGAASEVADARMGGLKGGIEQLRGSVDSFLTEEALPFLDTLGNIAREAAEVINKFDELPQPVQDATLAFAGTLAIAGPLALALAGVTAALGFIGGAAGLAVLGVAAFAAAYAADVGGIKTKTEEINDVLSTFWRYLSRVAESGEAFHSTLMMLPRPMAGFAFDVGKALVSVQDFGRDLKNFKSYISDVVTEGNALNIWLFTMTPGFADFAFQVGEAVVAVQNFGTKVKAAFSKTIFPDMKSLWTDFQAGEFENIAKRITQSVKVLVYNLDVELNLTARAEELKAQLVGVVNGLTTAINNVDFTKVSQGIATGIDNLRNNITKLDFSGIDWAAPLKAGLITPAMLAIKGLSWVFGSDTFANLVTAVRTAIAEIQWADIGTSLKGLGEAILGQLKLIGADAISDIGAAFAALPMPKLPELKAPEVNISDFLPLHLEAPQVIVPNPAPVRVPPPDVIMEKPKPITVPEPQFDFKWETVGAFPVQVASGITTAFLGHDWTGTGQALGGFLGLWWAGEMGKLNFMKENPTLITGFNSWWNEFQTQIGAEMRAGFDAAIPPASFSELGAAIQTAFQDMISGLVDAIMGAFIEPKVPAMTNGLNMNPEIIRDFEWPTPQWMTDLMSWQPTTPQWITDLMSWQPAMPQWLSSLLDWQPSMPDWVAALLAALGGGGGGVGGGSMLINPERLPLDEPPLLGGKKGRYSARPDTGMDMQPLVWADYVKPLEWATYVTEFVWDTYIVPVTWNSYVDQLEWDAYVSPLEWASYISSLAWDSFVQRLSWNSYVGDLQWDSYVGDLQWGNYVPPLDWTRFVSSITVGGGSSDPQPQEVIASSLSPRPAANNGTVNITVHATVANDIDIHSLAQKLMTEIRRNTR